jgi:hypothetical protein
MSSLAVGLLSNRNQISYKSRFTFDNEFVQKRSKKRIAARHRTITITIPVIESTPVGRNLPY